MTVDVLPGFVIFTLYVKAIDRAGTDEVKFDNGWSIFAYGVYNPFNERTQPTKIHYNTTSC